MRIRTKIIVLVIEFLLLVYNFLYALDFGLDNKFIIKGSDIHEVFPRILDKAHVTLFITFLVQFFVVIWLVFTMPTKN